MYFPAYLTPQGQEILNTLISAKFRIQENVGFCKSKNLFGYNDGPKHIIICTGNIVNRGYDPYQYVNETLYHETVHSAQYCRGLKTLGIPKNEMILSPNKLQDVKNSMRATGNINSGNLEYEAYWLEDKPEQVNYYLRKFCF